MPSKVHHEYGKRVEGPLRAPTTPVEATIMPIGSIIGLSLGMYSWVFFADPAMYGILGGAIFSLFTMPHKQKVIPDGNGDADIITFNMFGKQTDSCKLSSIAAIELVKGCGEPNVLMTLTDAAFEAAQKKAGCCKCIVSHTYRRSPKVWEQMPVVVDRRLGCPCRRAHQCRS